MPSRVLHQEAIPFITLPNWIKAATHCGFNIQPIFQELGIETDLINLESATIERTLLDRLMEACVQRSLQQPQNSHFPFVLGETFAFDYLPDLETFLTTSPTLREAIRVFEWVRQLINPMLDVQLHERPEEARLVLQFIGLEAHQVPRPWFSETMFAAMLKFGRLLMGDADDYRLLRLRHAPPDYAQIYEPFFRMPVSFSEPEYALEFASALLDRPLSSAYPAVHEQARLRVERRLQHLPRRAGLIATIELAYERKPALLGMGVEHIAAEIDLHPRTLQRRLREEGESFLDLLSRVRYRRALELLKDPTVDIENISDRLGFSDRRSFSRAFQRWSGVTPSEFRLKGS